VPLKERAAGFYLLEDIVFDCLLGWSESGLKRVKGVLQAFDRNFA
jgi:hypothetical protein